MAQTHYSKTFVKPPRRAGVLPRAEWLGRARETAARGSALPQSKLTPEKIADIRSAAVQRRNLLEHIRNNLSNEAMARLHGVHVRTIEKALGGETWSQVE